MDKKAHWEFTHGHYKFLHLLQLWCELQAWIPSKFQMGEEAFCPHVLSEKNPVYWTKVTTALNINSELYSL